MGGIPKGSEHSLMMRRLHFSLLLFMSVFVASGQHSLSAGYPFIVDDNSLLSVQLNEPGEAPLKDDDIAAAVLASATNPEAATLYSPEDVSTIDEREIYLLEDKDYPKSLYEHYPGVGQVSGITALPTGDVAIVHRSGREWDEKTFSANYSVADANKAQDNLIKNDTISIIERLTGAAVTTLGANLFYMPHSIASDEQGNLWVSDVARHQVMRLPTSMMQYDHVEADGKPTKRWLPGNLSRIWPDIILGEAFVPGQDEAHFCQPSEIEVSSDGQLVFVADGYCNQRIMVFTGSGKFLMSFGQEHNMKVVHSLTLLEERNLLCAADRENARILCFRAGLDGAWSTIGQLRLVVEYPLGRVFAIEALGPNHMLVSSIQHESNRYDLGTLNPFTRELKQTWASTDLVAPHSLARTKDGLHVYAADMSKGAYRKVYKFDIIRRKH